MRGLPRSSGSAELADSASFSAMAAIEHSDAMLVVGSPLMVYSGYRFFKAMADAGTRESTGSVFTCEQLTGTSARYASLRGA